MMRHSPPKVALLFEPINSYARGLLRGIGEFMLGHERWHVHYVELGTREGLPEWLLSWNGAGVIVRGENPKVARLVEKLRMPVVDLTPSRLLPRAPWVKSDDGAIARLAVTHFIERGFRHFAYCGISGLLWSDRRGDYFRQYLQEAGYDCHLYKKSHASRGDAETDRIGQWLKTLPRPLAVFTCLDTRGRQVVEACLRAGLSVPEEVAVLGVDDDEVVSALSPVPLSSVVLNPHRAGWEAAALLSRMMAGENAPQAELFVPPISVATRQSSDVLAVHDPQIAQALRFIREHGCEGIGVGDVLRHCPMARRVLEQRFQRLLGRTPREEIVRIQIMRARELLIGTDLSMSEIAARVGFETAYFSVIFKRQTGVTPREFRNRER